MVERIVQQIDVQGDDQVRAKFASVGDAGAKAMDKTAKAGENLNKSLEQVGGSLGRVADQVAPVNQGFKDAAKAALSFGGTIGKLTAGVTLLAGGMLALAVNGAKVGSAVKEASIRIGTTASNFTKLGFAFEQSGSSAEALEKAFGVIFDAAAQGGEAAKPFEKLGIALTDAAGRARDPAKVLGDIAEKFAAIEDPAQRSQTAIDLFGRRVGAGLVEGLSAGRKGLEELGKEAEQLGLVFDESQLKLAKQFGDTLNRLTSSVSATIAKIGIAFIPLFDPIVDAIGAKAGNLQQAFVRVAEAITTFLKPLFEDFANLVTGNLDKVNSAFLRVFGQVLQAVSQALGPAFVALGGIIQGIVNGINLLTSAFNSFFGTSLSTGDLIAFGIALRTILGIIFSLTAAMSPWGVAIALVIGLINTLLATLTNEQWQAFATTIRQIWTSIQETIGGVIKFVIDKITSVNEFLDKWIERLKTVIQLGRQALGSGGDQQTQGAGGFAGGGPVRGPGTSRSDSILARVSNGEFVHTARAVRKYGMSFMRSINNLQFPRFADGGLVGIGDALASSLSSISPNVSFSDNGSGRRPFTLVLPNGERITNMTAGDDAISRLEQFAVLENTRRTGRRPTWSGS